MSKLGTWLREQKVAWLLVREDGSAILAAPLVLPVERFMLPSGGAPRTLEDCLAVARRELSATDSGLEGVVVSVPRSFAELDQMEELVRGGGARHLDSEQLRALEETGMDVPFGDWADPERASLYWLPSHLREEPVKP